jgi:hypothetical protein
VARRASSPDVRRRGPTRKWCSASYPPPARTEIPRPPQPRLRAGRARPAGGYSQLRDYVRRVRARTLVEPVARFETDPGHQGQVESPSSAPVREALRPPRGPGLLASALLRFYERPDMQTLVAGLEAAFSTTQITRRSPACTCKRGFGLPSCARQDSNL